MSLSNRDLPFEIQSLKGKSEADLGPVQDPSCKLRGFASTFFRSASLHPFPASCCRWKSAPTAGEADSVCTWGTSETDYTQSAAKCNSKPTEGLERLRPSVFVSNLWGYM